MTTVLCWDVDGTLLTTQRAGVTAWKDALWEVGRVDRDLVGLRSAGLTDAQIAELLAADTELDDDPANAERLLRHYEKSLPDSLHLGEGGPLPGVIAILESLRGRDDVLSILLTGNTPAGARAKLAHYGLAGYFHAGAFCEGPGERASIAERALVVAAEQLGAAPDHARVYVIGDTPHDVACGKAIGARTIAVASGSYSLAELEACEPWRVLAALPEPSSFARLLGLP